MENYQNFESMDDLLFSQRNKAYGAYQLRKNYGKTLRNAVLLGTFSFVCICLFVFAIVPRNLVATVPFEPTHVPPPQVVPDIPPTVPEKPLPPTPPPPPQVATAYIPDYKPVLDDMPEMDKPTNMTELDGKAIGTQNIEGTATEDLVAPTPPTPPTPPSTPEPAPEAPSIFTKAEFDPAFPGGVQGMYKWLGKNLRYPTMAEKNSIGGTVFVSFVVEKDGSISTIKILKGIGFGCDDEAKRVVAKMPKWQPGMQNGQAVRVIYTLPLKFQLLD